MTETRTIRVAIWLLMAWIAIGIGLPRSARASEVPSADLAVAGVSSGAQLAGGALTAAGVALIPVSLALGDTAGHGDGAVLMKLGTLATIGRLGPDNFHHVVFDNGSYESTGAQPTSSPAVDLAAVAVACGYTCAETVDAAEGFRRAMERQTRRPGPTLLRMVIKTGSRKDLGRPKLKPRDGWLRFCAYLRRGREDLG